MGQKAKNAGKKSSKICDKLATTKSIKCSGGRMKLKNIPVWMIAIDDSLKSYKPQPAPEPEPKREAEVLPNIQRLKINSKKKKSVKASSVLTESSDSSSEEEIICKKKKKSKTKIKKVESTESEYSESEEESDYEQKIEKCKNLKKYFKKK